MPSAPQAPQGGRLWQSCQPDCRVSHSSSVTAFCWSPTQQGRYVSVCRSSPLPTHHQLPKHHSCQNTTDAKTLQMQKHHSCQNTADAKTPQMPKHHRCQNTADAKTPQLPKHHRCQNTTLSCQNTTDAKTPQMPNGMN